MRVTPLIASICGLSALLAAPVAAQTAGSTRADTANDPIKMLASRLELDRYKETIKGLTQFGDRRQGTDRNANAVTWIESKLKSYGCADVERIVYDFQPAPQTARPALDSASRAAAAAARAAAAASGQAQGGGRTRGIRARTGVNTDSLAQKDLKLRALNSQPTTPGKREEVYCTKVGSTHPNEMYIIGAHMDGHGWGEAANDDGSGTAIVMELARIFSMPDVKTDRSIRFALWNNEETGLNGARAYIAQREALQGKESPAGSGKYPEPKWLGMIQHDMMMFDHGMPRADGTLSPEQRPEADVNVEFQSNSKMATESQKLAWFFHGANEKYATDYPAAVGPHMTNTDSAPFQDIIPSISLRENERGREIGAGWDPHWHQVTDMFSTFTDKDFRLGLNAAQTTLGAIAMLTGATVNR
ncbi:MAG: M20/M25/M40 family metallo-hydrolase [Gemmatimonadaceae bacterium]